MRRFLYSFKLHLRCTSPAPRAGPACETCVLPWRSPARPDGPALLPSRNDTELMSKIAAKMGELNMGPAQRPASKPQVRSQPAGLACEADAGHARCTQPAGRAQRLTGGRSCGACRPADTLPACLAMFAEAHSRQWAGRLLEAPHPSRHAAAALGRSRALMFANKDAAWGAQPQKETYWAAMPHAELGHGPGARGALQARTGRQAVPGHPGATRGGRLSRDRCARLTLP